MQKPNSASQHTSTSRVKQESYPDDNIDSSSSYHAPTTHIQDPPSSAREWRRTLTKPMSVEVDNGPCYFPYQAQHLVLTTTQRLLEECCFDFLKRCLPDLIRDRKWECAAMLELHKWLDILGDPQWKAYVEPNLARPFAAEVLHDIRTVRHAAVYRSLTTASAVGQLVQSALRFADTLQDNRCVSHLELLKSGLDTQIKIMEKAKQKGQTAMIQKIDSLLEQRKYAILEQKRSAEEVKTEAGQQIGELVGRVCRYKEGFVKSECVAEKLLHDVLPGASPESGTDSIPSIDVTVEESTWV